MSRHPGKIIHRRTISAGALLLAFIFLISISLAGGLVGPGGTSAASKQDQAVRLEAALVPLRQTSPPAKQVDPVAQDQDDVVKVSTDLVVVNATVLDKEGKFVPRLKRTDFQILEDGAEQKIASFSAEETPFAAAILLDTSGSMESRLTLGRSAAIRFLDGLREEDVAAAFSLGSKVEQWRGVFPGPGPGPTRI